LKDELVDLQLKDMTGFNVASGLTFGFSFLIASFAVFLIKVKAFFFLDVCQIRFKK
jgi:hypothetical protein